MAQLVIDVAPDGAVKIDAIGFKGNSCDKATQQIEVALGGQDRVKKNRKPDFYAKVAPAGKATQR